MQGSVYPQPKLASTLAAVGLTLLLCACSHDVNPKTNAPANIAVASKAPPASAADPHQLATAVRDAESAKTDKPFDTSFSIHCNTAHRFKGKLGLSSRAV